MKVKTAYDTWIDFADAVALMDGDIREKVHADLAPCTEQEFFDEYAQRHEEVFGDEFEPTKLHPAW